MSIFYCYACDRVRDSDDGCEELMGALFCQSCADDAEPFEDPEYAAPTAGELLASERTWSV